jgi:hypothetical protein
VSRLRLRRTRQQPVWISNGVLVLGYLDRTPGNGDRRVDLRAADGVGGGGITPELRAFAAASVSGTHVGCPGAPARVASQEAASAMKCPAHVFGWAADVLTREARSSRRLQGHPHNSDNGGRGGCRCSP